MKALRILLFLVAVVWPATLARADVNPAEALAEAERIENLRILHRYGVCDLHDAKALALYLKGWKGPDHSAEVETMLQEAEDLFGSLAAIEKGSQGLLAEIEAMGPTAVSSERLALLQRARRTVAAEINDFYARGKALKEELKQQVKARAAEAIQWQEVSAPEPWADPQRDYDRRLGWQRGMFLRKRKPNEPAFFDLPERDQDYALAKAAKIGITYMHLLWDPLSNWADMEPEPGRYDFTRLDGFLRRLAAHNIRACLMLRSLTGSPPQWFIDKHGNACRFTVTVNTRGGEPTQRQEGINLMHKPTGEAFGAFLAAYAAHLRERWGGQVDAIYVEGGQYELTAPADESAAMDAYWRAWSKTDTPWRTPEALQKDEQAGAAAVARAKMCREAWLLDYVRAVRDALKRGWPDVRVQTMTTNQDFHRLHAWMPGESVDLYRQCQLTDNPGTRTSATGPFQMLRSFSDGKWTWSWGMHTGSGATPAADFSQALFQDVSRISGGWFTGNVLRLTYPTTWYRYQDRQLGGFGISSYFLAPRRCQEIAPVVLNTSAAPASVAVLWSQATRRLDNSRELFMSAVAWSHLLKRICVNFDYIADEDPRFAQTLGKYRFLILPNTQAMTAETCDAIRAWVRAGGTLLGFGAPGLYDELGGRRTSLPLADVFGADVARMRLPGLIRPDNLETTHPEGAYTPLPPLKYKFQTNLTAALRVIDGTPRAWFVGPDNDVAIVEHTFGQGRAMLSGFPLGNEYWKTNPYEISFGLTYFRLTWVHEQVRYEEWLTRELSKLGVEREVILTRGRFLRAQRGDDPDWFHIFRNNPEYSEYMIEEEKPVRSVHSFCRRREGIDNVYVGLSHTEGNYSSGRGFFRCTLSGCEVNASVAAAGAAPVVFDVRLRVPVPSTSRNGRVNFTAWLPMAQSAAFAVAPTGVVRLFGDGSPTGIGPDDVARETAEYDDGAKLAAEEVLDRDRIAAFLRERAGRKIVIGCGDRRFRPAAVALAMGLKDTLDIDATITMAGPRATTQETYMLGFGYTRIGPEPVHADVLIGNCQDNGLMWKFIARGNEAAWLPVEVNQNFPGLGRVIVMLSSPVTTNVPGRPNDKRAPQQLIIGASYPSEAMQGVRALGYDGK